MQDKIMKIVGKAVVAMGAVAVTEVVKGMIEKEREKAFEAELDELERDVEEITADINRLLDEAEERLKKRKLLTAE